jgi:signal transduction histidine kinase
MKYLYHNIIFLLLISIAFHHPLAFADTADEIKQEIAKIYSLLSVRPKVIFSKVTMMRKQYKKHLSPTNKADLFHLEAWAYLNTNKYQLALTTIEKINQLSISSGDIFQWNINNTKANIYWQMGQGQKSLEHNLIAYELIKKDPLNLTQRIATEGNIGYISVQLGFYQEALPYLKKVLAHYLTTDNDEALAIAYNNLGEALFHLNQVEQAFTYHQKALAIRIEHKLNFHASYSYHNLGLVYLYRKDYPQAKTNFLKAINIRADSNYILGLLESQIALAKVYQATQQYDDFTQLLTNIVLEANQHKNLTMLANAYHMQSDFFEVQHLYQKALRAFKHYTKTLEDVQLKKSDSHLAQYLTESSTVEKDINILKLQKLNEIQTVKAESLHQRDTILFIATAVIVSTLSIFLWLLQLKRKKIQHINQNLSSALNQLKTTQNKLIESEKMSALTTLVSGMAHQMNTPLGVGITAMSMIKEKIEDFSTAVKQGKIKRTSLDTMLSDLNQASQIALGTMNKTVGLVSQFKRISTQLEGDKQEQFELFDVLITHADMIIEQLKENKPSVNIHGNKVSLLGYPSAIGKVLTQLINNSIEHGFTDTTSPSIDIDIEVKALKQSVEILYRDNGKGIEQAQVNKIFDPFYTSRMGSDSVGLGLSIVYNLVVQLMQGSISVEPSTEQGTMFCIQLPLKLTINSSMA